MVLTNYYKEVNGIKPFPKQKTDRQAGRQADRQTGRQADRQTGRQADRQTDSATIF